MILAIVEKFGKYRVSYYFIFSIKVKLIKYLISINFLEVNELPFFSTMNLYQNWTTYCEVKNYIFLGFFFFFFTLNKALLYLYFNSNKSIYWILW